MISSGGAASKLQNITLPTGWKVVSMIAQTAGQTGGHFSCCYEVTKNGKRGFLKAFDFSAAFEDPKADTIAVVRQLTSCYEHEREILFHCKERRLSRIVTPLESGEFDVPGMKGIEGRAFSRRSPLEVARRATEASQQFPPA